MYIFGTTVLNAQLLPSQLFINGIGLTTDGVYRIVRKKAAGKELAQTAARDGVKLK